MAKKNSLREWFGQNDGKGWVDCKTGKPLWSSKRARSERVIPLVDHNGAVYFCCKEKESPQNELVGRTKKQMVV